MYPKTKSGKKVYLPTPEEDTSITAAAMSDPDTLPPTDAKFAKLKRVGRPRGCNQRTNHYPLIARSGRIIPRYRQRLANTHR